MKNRANVTHHAEAALAAAIHAIMTLARTAQRIVVGQRRRALCGHCASAAPCRPQPIDRQPTAARRMRMLLCRALRRAKVL